MGMKLGAENQHCPEEGLLTSSIGEQHGVHCIHRLDEARLCRSFHILVKRTRLGSGRGTRLDSDGHCKCDDCRQDRDHAHPAQPADLGQGLYGGYGEHDERGDDDEYHSACAMPESVSTSILRHETHSETALSAIEKLNIPEPAMAVSMS